jgi:EmrB/QacA subfamily drug resistance transporter
MEHAASRPHYNLTFAILALGGITYALLQSLVVPALHEIQVDLHTSTTSATWVLTAFLLSASVATPILGRLGDMFGKKRLLVLTLVVVVLGTLLAALASSLGLLLVGRAVQGLGGAIFPLAFGIIRDEFPRERVAGGIALMSAILGVGAGLGIVLAGPIVAHLSYHWLFWLPLLASAGAALGTLLVVPESPVRVPARVDWPGALGLSAWLVALLVAVSQGSTWGWSSSRVVGLFAASAVLLVAWTILEARTPAPLVDMRMMRLRGVWTTNVSALLIGFGMFGAFVLVPQFVEMPPSTGYGFGASVTQAGLFLAPATLAMLIVSPFAGRLSGTVGSRVPLLLGAVVSVGAFTLLALAHGERWEIYLGTTLMGVGIGLAFSAMANLIVEAVPGEQTGVATGMNTIMRSIGGALGGTVSASVLAGSLAASGLPREHGFTLAFGGSAIALVAAVVAALAVPRRRLQAVTAPTLAAE